MSLSIVDKHQNNSHLHHFVVQTRSFQIEKARNVEMYENLRIHIERQNEKKKQEMEMSEELKRARREKELKHRRDKSTLSEVKEEIIKSQARLEDLKAEKHRLFTEFKKILGEDEIRKTNQRIREAEAQKNLNMTFGPVTSNTANTSNQRPPHQTVPSSHAGPIMPSSSHSNANILPSTLHHLHPIQPMFYSQQHGQAAATSANSPNILSASSSNASREQQSRQEQSALGHHRLNGRIPTPTSYAPTSLNSQGRQQPQIINQRSQQEPPVSIYSNNKAPHQLHPGAPLSLTSMASSVSSAASIIPIPSSGATSYTSDRHRMSYKRSHEQSSISSAGPSINLHPPTTAGGVISGQSGSDRQSSHHQHFLHHSNFKHNLGQHSQQPPAMHQLPPGAFPQLGGHNLEHLQGLPTLYQSYLSQSYQANNPPYMNNMDRK
ncbi:PREDICTED: G protein pathway suppressor 2 [Rhagoletis zephyria]|uniref:G protein pathway suppressor 2 n=1 Tax=Rhagoletis zephyria TaxID=28612 RepID=UPI00081127C1|nr:PREDICTED: G protein pathway suppressor 2 [Rhagoletis zephyria]